MNPKYYAQEKYPSDVREREFSGGLIVGLWAFTGMAQVQSLVGEMQLTEMKSQWSSMDCSSNVTVSLGAQSTSSAQGVLSLLQGRWVCDLRMHCPKLPFM